MSHPPLLRTFLLTTAFCGLTGAAAFAAVTVQSNSTSNVIETTPLEVTPQRLENLQIPDGFTLTKFAEIQNPRVIRVNPKNGDVYVSQREPGTISLLRDTDGDGRADVQRVVFTRKQAHGIAIKGDEMFIMTIRELYKAPIKSDGTLGKPKLIANDFPDAGQHPNRTLDFGPDGKLYISVGSTTNAANERNEENATIIQADANGKNRRVFASGLRNTIGFDWHPTTKRFYGWDHGIDTLGDDEAKEEINEIQYGKRYGWPFVYEDGKLISHPLPPAAFTREDWRDMTTFPRLMHTAHSAGLQWQFYDGSQFPAEYKGDAFVTLRGSWNRNPPSGYQLARIKFDEAGNPTAVEPFISGFLLEDPAPDVKWGNFARLVGLAQTRDGALLMGDDTNNTIYRVAYGAKNTPRPSVAALDARLLSSQILDAPKTIAVTSNVFKEGGTIPVDYTAYGNNLSPDLHWTNLPAGTQSVVVIMEDPIARAPKPAVHWLVANIAPDAAGLPLNVQPNSKPKGGQMGGNILGEMAYFGPKPPADGLDHEYHFQVFALKKKLDLPMGYNRVALLDAMAGNVLARGELVGKFERKLG